MGSLGSFAAAKREYAAPAEPDTFEFAGETFTVKGPIPGMVKIEVGAFFAGQINGNEGAAAIRSVIQSALTSPAREEDGEPVAEDDSEWVRFRELAVDQGIDTEELTELAYVLLGAEMGRPTERRSTSSDGSLPTSTSSNTSASDSPA